MKASMRILLCCALLLQTDISQTIIKEKNMFGTDGIRNRVGRHPFTADALPQLGSAIARWAEEKYGNNPTILLGHDTRNSCHFVQSGLEMGLLHHGVTVYYAGVMTTPSICYLTTKNPLFDCGIVISASHNPSLDNGIKIIDGNNIKMTPTDEQRITELFYDDTAQTPEYTNLGTRIDWHKSEQEYIDQVIQHFKHNFLHGHTIVLDCSNGAAHKVAPRIFKRCGARVISLHKHPSGHNINNQCGAQHTESLQKAVLEHKASAGFAFDGDADRVVMVLPSGEVEDGDGILFLLMQHELYKTQQHIVGTVMTNEAFNVYLQEHDKTLFRTPVGDKYIAQKLEEINGKLGGEQSGHIIMRDYLKTGDGVMTALRVMEVLLANNFSTKTFTRYPQILINIPITVKKDLTQEPLAGIIKAHEARLYKGRIVVRYSGTENLLRVMVEDSNKQNTDDIAHSLAHELQQALSNA